MSLINDILKSSLESSEEESSSSTLSLVDINSAIDEHLIASPDIVADMKNAITAHELVANNTTAAHSLDIAEGDNEMLIIAKESIKTSLGCESLSDELLVPALEAASGTTGNLVYTTTARSNAFIEEAFAALADKAKHLSSAVDATQSGKVNCKTNKLSVHGKVDPSSLTHGLKAAEVGMDDIYGKYLGGLETLLVNCYAAAIDSSKSPGWGLFKRWILSGGGGTTAIAIVFASMKRYKLALGSLQGQFDGFIKTIESMHSTTPALGELSIKFDRDFGLAVSVDTHHANNTHTAEALTKEQIKQICKLVAALSQSAVTRARANHGKIENLSKAWLSARQLDAKNNTGILSSLVRVFRTIETRIAANFFTKRCMEPLVYGHHIHEGLAAVLNYCETSMKK